MDSGTMRRLELRHIVCPIDFSSPALGSLRIASAIARQRRAELRAVHVVPSQGLAVPEPLGSLERQALMSRLRASLEEVTSSFHLIGSAIRRGDPGTQILRFARELPADLIVIGAPGADRPERPTGPIASVVVARSECPVLTVPSHHTTWSNESGLFRNIVCAVDLAPSSTSVILQALYVAWETHAHLTYVYVVPEGASTPAAARDRVQDAIPSYARGWCRTDVLVARGTADEEIVRIAEELHADLVILGAPRRWTSTTHAVLSRSLCPVLVTHDARPLPRPVLETYEKAHAPA
jgi:nucleotide-binding universal stress UspA family protein